MKKRKSKTKEDKTSVVVIVPRGKKVSIKESNKGVRYYEFSDEAIVLQLTGEIGDLRQVFTKESEPKLRRWFLVPQWSEGGRFKVFEYYPSGVKPSKEAIAVEEIPE